MKISIIIPTLNGGPLLVECLNSIISQESPFVFDIIIIDSGSNDSSIASCIKILQNAGIIHKLIVIDSSEFNHGETRNIAIRNTTSDVLVFLTQDSIPNSETWLVELVSPFMYFKQLAGVFGRHIPHINHPKINCRHLNMHFNHMANIPLRNKAHHMDYAINLRKRQIMHFFSNNNSAILRKYWNDIPFQSTDFGEDQLWAHKIIENRLTIYYAEKAIVRHSHNFTFVNAIKRKSIELNYFYNNFGYRTEKTMKTFFFMLKSVISDFKWLNNNHKNIFEMKAILKINFSNFISILLFNLRNYFSKN